MTRNDKYFMPDNRITDIHNNRLMKILKTPVYVVSRVLQNLGLRKDASLTHLTVIGGEAALEWWGRWLGALLISDQ
jgi:hypothetical protein